MPALQPYTKVYQGAAPTTAFHKAVQQWPYVEGGWAPSDLTGLVVWLDAVDYTGSAWPNRGSDSAPTVVGTPAMTIVSAGLNGLPVVRFKPNEGRIRGGWSHPIYDYTLVYLVRFVGPNAGRAFSVQYPPSNLLVGIHSSGYDQMYDNGEWRQGPAFGTWPTTWRMYGADSELGQGAAFFINGSQIGTRTGGSGGFTNGWAMSGYDAAGTPETMDIEVAEMVLYSRRLSGAERIQVEGYLNTKWGLA